MIRGVIEGFYGTPWSHDERLDLIRFCADEGFDTWVHAPKDDPYHRERWREPYPDDELTRLAELRRIAVRSLAAAVITAWWATLAWNRFRQLATPWVM